MEAKRFGQKNRGQDDGRNARQLSGAELGVAKAVGGVVVNHADGLHEGVANGGANELEAAF